MHFMMISCKRATELVDKRQSVGLTGREIVKLRFHTIMCRACRRYEEQSRLIDGLLKKQLGESSGKEEIPQDHTERLIERILAKKK